MGKRSRIRIRIRMEVGEEQTRVREEKLQAQIMDLR
jgi:hypothetical protein